MSILTIQFGQCGNQIGHSLFTYLANDINYEPSNKVTNNLDYKQSALKRWFNNDKMEARTILVDTENKVISKIKGDKNLVNYRNVVAKSEGGSANNWAYGYFDKSDSVSGDVLELLRREVEKSDEILSIFNILSSGGGTGSGVGSSIIEKVREEYPNKTIFNCLVLPYNEGEVVTQNYNTLLTLAKLYDITDGTLVFENAILHKICSELLAMKDVKLSNINSVIVQKVAALLQPAKGLSISNLTDLTSHPSYKLLQIYSLPHVPEEYVKFETVQTWFTLANRLKTVLLKNNHTTTSTSYTPRANVNCKSAGNLLISRGGLTPEMTHLDPINDDQLYTKWLPKDKRLTHCHSSRNLYNTTNFLAMATNSGPISNILDPVVEDAWNLFNNEAFLHQYEQFGMTRDEFRDAFIKMESIIQSYKIL